MGVTDALRGRALGWLLVVVVFAIALSATELADPDIWWATAAGRYFLEHGAAPPIAFYGEHGCYDAEPLDQVLAWSLFGGVHARFGLWGLFVVRAAFAIGVALLLALALRRRLRWPAAVASSGLVLTALSYRLSVRSELWTFLLLPVVLALFLRLVERAGSRARNAALLAVLVVVQLAWTVFHGAFPLGPLIALAASAGLLLDRAPRDALVRAALGVCALGLGVLLSPDGVAALLVAGVEREIARAGGFAEWAPLWPALLRPGSYRNPSYVAFVVLFGAWLLCLARRREHERFWSRWLVAAPLFVLAFDATRASAYASLSAIAWLPLLARPSPAGEGGQRSRRALLLVGLVAALVLARLSSSPLVRQGADLEALVPARLTPRDASLALKRLGLEGLLFARLHLGNWILLENHPRVRVLWTGRRTYTLACMNELLAARNDPAASFERARERFGFNLVLVDNAEEDALFRFLVDAGWPLLHFDLRFSLFMLPPAAGEAAPPLTLAPYEELAGAIDKEPLSDAGRATVLVRAAQKLAYVGHYDAALALFAAAKVRAPASSWVRFELAKLLAHLGRSAEARAAVSGFAEEPAIKAFLAALAADEPPRAPDAPAGGVSGASGGRAGADRRR